MTTIRPVWTSSAPNRNGRLPPSEVRSHDRQDAAEPSNPYRAIRFTGEPSLNAVPRTMGRARTHIPGSNFGGSGRMGHRSSLRSDDSRNAGTRRRTTPGVLDSTAGSSNGASNSNDNIEAGSQKVTLPASVQKQYFAPLITTLIEQQGQVPDDFFDALVSRKKKEYGARGIYEHPDAFARGFSNPDGPVQDPRVMVRLHRSQIKLLWTVQPPGGFHKSLTGYTQIRSSEMDEPLSLDGQRPDDIAEGNANFFPENVPGILNIFHAQTHAPKRLAVPPIQGLDHPQSVLNNPGLTHLIKGHLYSIPMNYLDTARHLERIPDAERGNFFINLRALFELKPKEETVRNLRSKGWKVEAIDENRIEGRKSAAGVTQTIVWVKAPGKDFHATEVSSSFGGEGSSADAGWIRLSRPNARGFEILDARDYWASQRAR